MSIKISNKKIIKICPKCSNICFTKVEFLQVFKESSRM